MKDLYALFRRYSLAGLRVLVAMTVLLGVVYPLASPASPGRMPWRADGSLVTATGAHTTDPDEAVGSALLGQLVDDPALFQPRPSAAGDGYDPLSTATAPTTAPRAPSWSRRSRSGRPRSPSARASDVGDSRRTR